MLINWKNLNSFSEIGLSTRLNFGKYSGEMIFDVLTWDANYIIYLYSIQRIKPSNELLDLLHKTIKYKERVQNEFKNYQSETTFPQELY